METFNTFPTLIQRIGFIFCLLYPLLTAVGQPSQPPSRVTQGGILKGEYHEYLKDNYEYRGMLQIYEQSQSTMDSCGLLLEKSALTIRNSSFTKSEKSRIIEVIEAANNKVSGDIYGKFKYFDDPFMNRIKGTIRVATLYECEIAILKAMRRREKVEQWASLLARVINEYYQQEFSNYELIRQASTYQELMDLEIQIDSLFMAFQQSSSLPEKDHEKYRELYFQWSLNRSLLRNNDERTQLFEYLKSVLENRSSGY